MDPRNGHSMLVLAALVALAPLPALAQADQCAPPGRLDPSPPVRPDGPTRRTPIAGYTLALSWSPAFCQSPAGRHDRLQCGGAIGRFGFVVHGLWPEGSGPDNAPQWCSIAPRPAPELLRRNMCMMPSPRTLEHEWLKHGTCAFRTPEAYFGAEARLWQALRLPDTLALARRRGLTVGDLRSAFVAANRGLAAEAVAVDTHGPWLSAVRLCLGTDLRPRACPGWARGAGDRAGLRIDSD